MSNPPDSEGEPLCCTYMWGSALAFGVLPFIHKMGEITSVWDETLKWAGYEVRQASQNSIMPNSHLLARKIRGVWIAVMWHHRCVSFFSFSAWERVILHNPIQLYCVYSDTVTDIRGTVHIIAFFQYRPMELYAMIECHYNWSFAKPLPWTVIVQS